MRRSFGKAAVARFIRRAFERGPIVPYTEGSNRRGCLAYHMLCEAADVGLGGIQAPDVYFPHERDLVPDFQALFGAMFGFTLAYDDVLTLTSWIVWMNDTNRIDAGKQGVMDYFAALAA